MAAPMLMASAKRGAKPGPAKWVPGTKLWDTMVWHKHVDLLAKYPGTTTVDATTNGNDSMYQGLKRKELCLSVEACASSLSPNCCELFNGKRMAIGFSEFGGVLDNLNHVIKDGCARQIYHATVAAKWDALWQKCDLGNCARQLNGNAFPGHHKTISKNLECKVFTFCLCD